MVYKHSEEAVMSACVVFHDYSFRRSIFWHGNLEPLPSLKGSPNSRCYKGLGVIKDYIKPMSGNTGYLFILPWDERA